MTADPRIAHLHQLADEGVKEAGSAARAAHEARAAMFGMTPGELKAHYRKILAGPPVSPEGLAKVAALFGLVVIPDPAPAAGEVAP